MNYLLLDENDIAVNYIVLEEGHDWPTPEGLHLVPYDGPFWEGAKFDGEQLIDPDPPPPVPELEHTTAPQIDGLPTV